MAIGTSQAFRTQNFRLLGNFYDKDNWVGKKGYALSSDENGVHWEADQNETSGIFSGGIMTATIGGTTFNVSAGVGQVVSRTLDIPTGEVKTNTTRVSWNTQSNIALTYRTTHPFSYIYIDENGAVQQQNSSFTDAEYKNKIILGTICHIDLATINLVTNKQNITYGDSHRLYELISTFGPIKRNGLAVSAYTTNLRLKRESGVAFLIGSNYTTDQFEPDSISLNSANPASLCRVYKNGTGGFVFDTNGGSFYTDVDPNKYDNGSGTLQTVNNNQWTIQRLFFFPNNPNDIIAYYGVGIYNSYGDAVTAMATESFSEATITAENAVFLAYLVVRGGALDLSLSSDGKFFQSGAFRNIGAIGGGGGGAGAIILDDLTDVAITTPLDGQFLAYDGGASLWKNSTLNAVNPLVFSGIGTSLTLSLNYATASQPGGVSTSAQTFGGVKTFASNVIVSGNLTVNGSTTTIDAQTLVVKDKNIELGVVASPTDLTADGGGITLKGTTDKTFNWIDATDSWTSSENLDLASGKSYKINGADVLTSTTLGSGVINSSLQSVGALNNLTVAGYAYLATTSGNVGVGTVTTNAKLDILQSSTSNNQLRIYSNDATPQLRTYTTSDGYGLIINQYYAVGGSPYLRSADFVASTGDVSSTMMRFFTKPYSSNPVERVRITSDGIVGIGAVNPSNSKLHIYADHISGHSVLKIQTITAIAGGGVPSLGFFDSDGSRNTLLYAASDGTYLANEVTKPIFFSTNSTIKMTVTSTGNVGIGTTTPNQFLEVRRTTGSAIALLNYNDTVKLNINASSGGAGYVGMVSNHPLILVTNDTEKVKIGTNGNVCIGNADANNKLSVLGSASIGSNYNVAAPTNGLIVEGNVGIGTSTVSTKLHVSGGSYVSNIVGTGDLRIENTDTVGVGISLKNHTGKYWFMYNGGSSSWAGDGVLGFVYTDGVNAATAPKVVFKSDGNVGIGTNNPNATLQIAGTSTGILTVGTLTNNWGGVVAIGVTNGNGVILSKVNTSNDTNRVLVLMRDDTNGAKIEGYTSGGASTDVGFLIRAGASSYFNGGNVGIGTANPGAKLEVIAANTFASIRSNASNAFTYLSIGRTASDFEVGVSGGSNQFFTGTAAGDGVIKAGTGKIHLGFGAAAPSITIDTSNNVGIGTVNPSYKLHIVASSAIVSSNILRLDGGNTGFNGANDADTAFSIMFDACAYKLSTTVVQRNGAEIQMLKFGSWNEAAGGVGTKGSLVFKTNNGTIDSPDLSERMRIQYNGNIGIGNNSPVAKLDIRQTSASTALKVFTNDTSTAYIAQFIGYDNTLGDTTRMVVQAGGNVGIGTTTPAGLLDVRAATAGGKIILGTYDYNYHIRIESGDQLNFYNGASPNPGYINYGGGATVLSQNLHVEKATGGTTGLVRIKSDGNVGIGTTSPTNKLHIYSSANEPVFVQGTTAGTWMNLQSSTSNLWSLGADGTNGFAVYNRTTNAYSLMVRNNGNVGIGNITTSNNKLHVDGSVSIGSSYNVAGPTNGLVVEGSVGIGINSPVDLLTVQGNININYNSSSANYVRRTFATQHASGNRGANLWFGMVDGGGMMGMQVINAASSVSPYNSQYITFTTHEGGVDIDERMRISSRGNVGIGTTSPSSKLHISNSAAATRITITDDVVNGRSGYIESNYSDALVIGTTSGVRSIKFAPDNSTAMTIAVGTNNVGIGTTNPSAKLDINGDARIRSISASASAATIFLTTDANGVLISRTAAQVRSDIGAGTGSGTVTSVTGTAPIASSGGTTPAISLNDSGVTYAKIQNVSATARVLGRITAGAGVVEELTGANIATIIDTNAVTNSTNAANVTIATDDTTNSSYYLYFGANASGNTPIKASTKIRYNPSTGAFSATTKSFRIPHPTKPEHDLVYGSLESPYHGIRLTGKGKTNGTCVEIILPDYVNTLVDENTVNIQITAYKCAKVFYVENINIKDNKFVVKYDKSWYEKAKDVEFFWDFTAERKDVPKLVVEEKL